MAGSVTLYGDTVNGIDSNRVSTNYQVDFCPGDDFFVCDQNPNTWQSTGISGMGGRKNTPLGVWDTTQITPGTYTLRLGVTSHNAQKGKRQTFYDYYPVTVMDENDVPASDGSGLTIGQKRALGLDPTLPDTDGDGTLDGAEVGDPSNPVDSDGDGIIDALEPGSANTDDRVQAFMVAKPMATSKELPTLAGRVITIASSNGRLTMADAPSGVAVPLSVESDFGDDPEYSYPFGLLEFSVDTSGTSAIVTIGYPSDIQIPENAVYRKMDANGVWRTYQKATFSSDRHSVVLVLDDNDKFDSNPALGTVADPGGIAVPTGNGGGIETRGGGTGGGGSAAPLLIIVLLISGVLAGRGYTDSRSLQFYTCRRQQ